MASHKEVCMAKWTEPLTNELVSLLVTEVTKGNRTTSTFNKTGWNNIHVEFNSRMGLNFSVIQLKNRVNKLKKHYSSFKKLLSQSGFGWDNINNKVVVDDQSVWESHIKNNNEWAKFRNEGFPQYPDLCIVFGDTYATGNYASGNVEEVVGYAEEVVVSSERDDNGGDNGDGGSGYAVGDPEEFDEQRIDDEAFIPDTTTTLNLKKHKHDRTPNSKRRRKSTRYDVSDTCKAIQEMIKIRTAQSTSGSVTSDAPSTVDPYSTVAVVAILNSMPDLEQNIYNKAVNQSCLHASWREAFITMLPERRRGYLESL
ncbi:hypothetical protein EUGRSUZ_L00423 [Eucalyptus grandis]|uniref:Myb/SANT-like domain-containing protein n=1 Tax=Eucalyptus grandis TaxID=71139 RepID=A0A058ZWD0_EUCGR|nr:hypothetical protein EUGRSUZ_L00423 [Eucalyptus grandis]